MLFRQIIDPHLAQHAYLIGCQRTGQALVIDPQRDVDRYVELAARDGLRLVAAAETHIHADFLSGAGELVDRHGARAYLSAHGGPDWSYGWAGGRDVVLLRDGDRIELGGVEITALHTPGHTPEHLSYVVVDRASGAEAAIGVATGDFLFVGDLGRPDLLETAAGHAGSMRPSAEQLFASLERLADLPEFVQVWPGHGAGSACGKSPGAVPVSTIGYERRQNAALHHARAGRDAFVDYILDGQPAPPLYFARMKQLNRDGVPTLGSLPAAELCSPTVLAERVREAGGVVVDTRADRVAFMRRHLHGSVFAPFGGQLPAVVGSYVAAREPIGLVAPADRVETIVRDLVRIGYDEVVGFVEPAELETAAADAVTGSIERTTTDELGRIAEDPDTFVLDVRGVGEHAARHVPGSLNVPHTRLAERMGELPEDRRIAVHCGVGARAAFAAAQLARAGRRVLFVDGPISAWRGQTVRE